MVDNTITPQNTIVQNQLAIANAAYAAAENALAIARAGSGNYGQFSVVLQTAADELGDTREASSITENTAESAQANYETALLSEEFISTLLLARQQAEADAAVAQAEADQAALDAQNALDAQESAQATADAEAASLASAQADIAAQKAALAQTYAEAAQAAAVEANQAEATAQYELAAQAAQEAAAAAASAAELAAGHGSVALAHATAASASSAAAEASLAVAETAKNTATNSASAADSWRTGEASTDVDDTQAAVDAVSGANGLVNRANTNAQNAIEAVNVAKFGNGSDKVGAIQLQVDAAAAKAAWDSQISSEANAVSRLVSEMSKEGIINSGTSNPYTVAEIEVLDATGLDALDLSAAGAKEIVLQIWVNALKTAMTATTNAETAYNTANDAATAALNEVSVAESEAAAALQAAVDASSQVADLVAKAAAAQATETLGRLAADLQAESTVDDVLDVMTASKNAINGDATDDASDIINAQYTVLTNLSSLTVDNITAADVTAAQAAYAAAQAALATALTAKTNADTAAAKLDDIDGAGAGTTSAIEQFYVDVTGLPGTPSIGTLDNYDTATQEWVYVSGTDFVIHVDSIAKYNSVLSNIDLAEKQASQITKTYNTLLAKVGEAAQVLEGIEAVQREADYADVAAIISDFNAAVERTEAATENAVDSASSAIDSAKSAIDSVISLVDGASVDGSNVVTVTGDAPLGTLLTTALQNLANALTAANQLSTDVNGWSTVDNDPTNPTDQAVSDAITDLGTVVSDMATAVQNVSDVLASLTDGTYADDAAILALSATQHAENAITEALSAATNLQTLRGNKTDLDNATTVEEALAELAPANAATADAKSAAQEAGSAASDASQISDIQQTQSEEAAATAAAAARQADYDAVIAARDSVAAVSTAARDDADAAKTAYDNALAELTTATTDAANAQTAAAISGPPYSDQQVQAKVAQANSAAQRALGADTNNADAQNVTSEVAKAKAAWLAAEAAADAAETAYSAIQTAVTNATTAFNAGSSVSQYRQTAETNVKTLVDKNEIADTKRQAAETAETNAGTAATKVATQSQIATDNRDIYDVSDSVATLSGNAEDQVDDGLAALTTLKSARLSAVSQAQTAATNAQSASTKAAAVTDEAGAAALDISTELAAAQAAQGLAATAATTASTNLATIQSAYDQAVSDRDAAQTIVDNAGSDANSFAQAELTAAKAAVTELSALLQEATKINSEAQAAATQATNSVSAIEAITGDLAEVLAQAEIAKAQAIAAYDSEADASAETAQQSAIRAQELSDEVSDTGVGLYDDAKALAASVNTSIQAWLDDSATQTTLLNELGQTDYDALRAAVEALQDNVDATANNLNAQLDTAYGEVTSALSASTAAATAAQGFADQTHTDVDSARTAAQNAATQAGIAETNASVIDAQRAVIQSLYNDVKSVQEGFAQYKTEADAQIALATAQAEALATPEAYDDDITGVSEDSPQVIDLFAANGDQADGRADGGTIQLETVSDPAHGTIEIIKVGDPDYDPLKPGLVRYTPDPDYSGTDTFTYTISNGNGKFASADVTVTIDPTNDIPVAVKDFSSIANEMSAVDIRVLLNDTDVDGDAVSIHSIIGDGNGATAETDGSVTIYELDSNGDSTGKILGTATWAVGSSIIKFTPSADGFDYLAAGETDTFTFKYLISDGTAQSLPGLVTVTVTGENDAPSITYAPTAAPVFTEDGGAITIFDANFSAIDVDGDVIESVTIQLDGFAPNDNLTYTAQGGITGTYNSETGELTLTDSASSATNADYNAVIKSLQYSNSSQNPDEATRTVNVKISDGTLFSNQVSQTIAVSAQNDAPVIADNMITPALNATLEDSASPESTTVAEILSQLSITDVEGDPLGIAIVDSTSVNGVWQYYDNDAMAWTNMSVTSDANALLLDDASLVRFMPNANYFGTESLQLQVWDGTQGTNQTVFDVSAVSRDGTQAFSTDVVSATIDITNVNDAPLVNYSPSMAYDGFVEDMGDAINPPVSIIDGGGISVVDVDGDAIQSVTIRITNFADNPGFASEDILTLTPQNGVTGTYDSATGELVLTDTGGSATLNDFIDVVGSVQYQNTSQNPTPVARQIEVIFNDGELDSNVLNVSVGVATVNDAPYVVDPAVVPTLTSVLEDALDPAGTLVSDIVSQLDANDYEGDPIGIAVIDTPSTNGTWQYFRDATGEWTDMSGRSDGSAKLLDGNSLVRFVPNEDYNGVENLQFRLWDGTQGTNQELYDITTNGGSGSYLPFSNDVISASVEVQAVNDAPEFNLSTSEQVLGQGDGPWWMPTEIAVNSADGSYGIFWPGGDKVYGQLFDAAQQKIGPVFEVAGPSTGAIDGLSVVVAADGSYVVGMQQIDGANLHEVYTQKVSVNPDGTPVVDGNNVATGTTNGPINTVATGDQFMNNSNMIQINDAGTEFLITWRDERAGFPGKTYGRVVDSDGAPVGNEFVFDLSSITTDVNNVPTDMIYLGGGQFGGLFSSYNGSDDWDVQYGVFDISAIAGGAPDSLSGSMTTISGHVTGIEDGAQMTQLANGTLAIALADNVSGTNETVSYIINTDGTSVMGPIAVNSETAVDQVPMRVTSLADGGFIVFYWSNASGDQNVLGQRFDEYGAKVGSEFTVNTDLTGDQAAIWAEQLPSGEVVVSWMDSSAPIQAETTTLLVEGQTTPVPKYTFATSPDDVINTTTGNTAPSVPYYYMEADSHPDGSYGVFWLQNDSGYDQVLGRLYDSNGEPIGEQFLVNQAGQTTQSMEYVSVTTNDDGGYVVSYNANGVIYGASVSSEGVVSPVFETGGTTNYMSSVVSLGDVQGDGKEEYVIISRDTSATSNEGATLQVFADDGSVVSGPTMIPQNGTWQVAHEIINLGNGRFAALYGDQTGGIWDMAYSIYDYDDLTTPVVGHTSLTIGAGSLNSTAGVEAGAFAWGEDYNGQQSIKLVIFNDDGSLAVAPPLQVNTSDVAGGGDPAVAQMEDGSWMVLWRAPDGMGGFDIVGQHVGAGGQLLGEEFHVNNDTAGDQSFPQVVATGDGEFMATWVDLGTKDIEQRLFSFEGDGTPTPFQEILTFEDTSLSFDEATLLQHFSDIEGDSLSIVSVELDGVTLTPVDGYYTLTPQQDFAGSRSLKVTVSDGTAATTGAFKVVYQNVNDAPVDNGGVLGGIEQDSLNNVITEADLLANITDVDGDILTVTNVAIVTLGQHGLTNPSTGVWEISPEAGFSGALEISFDVSDGTQFISTTINLPVSGAPTDILLDTANVDENVEGAVIGNLSAVDPDAGDTHTFVSLDAKFEIFNGNQLKLKDGASLDFEGGETGYYDVLVEATDSSGLSFSKYIQVDINDVNEPISIDSAASMALDFTGKEVHADLVQSSAGPVSMELWFNGGSGGMGTNSTLIGNGTAGVNGYSISLYSDATNELHLNVEGVGTLVFSGVNVDTYEWNHVAVSYDGASWSAYLNGVSVSLDGTASGIDATASPITPTGDTVLGAGYEGYIDEARIWDSARTETDINATMNETVSGNETGLLASWSFNDGPSSVVLDRAAGDGMQNGVIYDSATMGVITPDYSNFASGEPSDALYFSTDEEVASSANKLYGLNLFDVDFSTEELSVTFTISDGTISFDESLASLTSVVGNGTSSVTIVGTIEDINNNVLTDNIHVNVGSATEGEFTISIYDNDPTSPLTTTKTLPYFVDYEPGVTVTGTTQTDVISGQFGDDELIGNGDSDTLYGAEGNDALLASGSYNKILGGEGSDFIQIVSQGTHYIDGQGDLSISQDQPETPLASGYLPTQDELDFDILSYQTVSGSGVYVNFDFGTVSGSGGTDYISNIDMVIATDQSDTYVGSGYGSAFAGMDGADTYYGSYGTDELRFNHETGANGIYVDLQNASITDTYGNVETYTYTDGSNAIERIRGSINDDTIIGSDGAWAERFSGLQGNDTIDGGAGLDDEIDYSRDIAGVSVDLSAGTATDGWGNTDTLSNLEHVRGSQFADVITGLNTGSDTYNVYYGLAGDDIFNGDGTTINYDVVSYEKDVWYGAYKGIEVIANTDSTVYSVTDGFGDSDTLNNIDRIHGTMFDDTFIGGSGVDSFRGLAGSDYFDGGDGLYDEVDYRGSSNEQGAYVDLGNGFAIDNYGDRDTLLNVERVRGTYFDDTIIGSDDDNRLRGYDGDDTLIGGAGGDTLEGGAGNDVLIGGTPTTAVLQSISQANSLSDGISNSGVLSSNGEWLAFASTSNTSMVDDSWLTSGGRAYLKNMTTGEIQYVSTDGTGVLSTADKVFGVSDDGRYVLFSSTATDLNATQDADALKDLYLKDMQTGVVSVVNTNSAGAKSTALDYDYAELSADGTSVIFYANQTSIPGETGTSVTVYHKDVSGVDPNTGTLTNVVADSSGVVVEDGSVDHTFAISSDGNTIIFSHSGPTPLISGLGANTPYIYKRDIQTDAIEVVSLDDTGANIVTDATNFSHLAVSSDARYVVFVSDASNVVSGVTGAQVYLRDTVSNTTTLVSSDKDGVATAMAISSSFGDITAVSDDGRFVVFSSSATDLVDGDTNASDDVFIKDMQSGAIERLNVAIDGSQAQGGASTLMSMSADGSSITFISGASNLFSNDTNAANDVFLVNNPFLNVVADGADTLVGGAGADVIVGGDGADVIVYQNWNDSYYVSAGDQQVDTLKDFTSGTDVLRLEGAGGYEYEAMTIGDFADMDSAISAMSIDPATDHIYFFTIDGDGYIHVKGAGTGLTGYSGLTVKFEGVTDPIDLTSFDTGVSAVNYPPQVLGVEVPAVAVEFDGVSNYINGGRGAGDSFDIATDLTIETWINAKNFSSSPSLVRFGGAGETASTNVMYQLYIDATGDVHYFHEYGAGVNVDLSFDTNLPINEWHHISMVRDYSDAGQSTVEVFIDGVSVGTQTFELSQAPESAIDATLHLGAADESRATAFEGSIADVRIWSEARSVDQVQGNYDRGLTNPSSEANLEAYWTFEDVVDEQNYVTDHSANGNHLVAFDSLSFDGTDDIATTSGTATIADHAVSAWISTSSTSDGTILSAGDATNYFNVSIMADGRLRVYLYDTVNGSKDYYATGITLNDGNWHNVGYSFDNATNTLELYVDGAIVPGGSITMAQDSSISFNVDAGLTFGEDNAGLNNFAGEMSEVALFGDNMSSTDFANIYTNGIESVGTLKLGHWMFNDGEGSIVANDAYGSPMGDAIITGMTGGAETWNSSTPSINNYAAVSLELNSGPGVDVGDFVPASGDITVSAWINPDDLYTSEQRIFSLGGSDFVLKLSASGDVVVSLNGGTQEISTGYWGDAGEWQNITATYNATTGQATIYFNGEQAISQNIGAYDISATTVGGIIGSGFDGSMGEVQYWTAELTQSQVETVINGDLTGSETDLAAYWLMNDGSGTFVGDETGNGHDGSVTVSYGWNEALPTLLVDDVEVREDTPFHSAIVVDDAEGDLVSFVLQTQAANGTVVVENDGSFVYTPNVNYTGFDQFTVRISDDQGNFTDHTVYMNVVASNVEPVANYDQLNVTADQSYTITVAELIANDTDQDGNSLDVTAVYGASNGVVVDHGDGTWTYTPDPGYAGNDSLSYTVSDGAGGFDTGHISLTVSAGVITGTSGFDTLVGTSSSDIINAQDGDDIVKVSSGNDTIDGGLGEDTLDYTYASQGVNVNLGTGLVDKGTDGQDNVTSFEKVTGSDFADTIQGDSVNNFINGRGGDDVIAGGDGDDMLMGGLGNDSLSGETGADDLQGGDGDDMLFGGLGGDTISVGNGSDIVRYTGAADSNLSGFDVISDFVTAVDFMQLDGAEHLSFGGDLGDLSIQGDITAMITHIESSGTVPTDTVVVFNDTVSTYVYAKVSDPGDAYKDFFVQMSGLQNLAAGDFNLSGGAGYNTIDGGSGADTLLGTAANDQINALDGNDFINGGLGADIISTGTGNDTVEYSGANQSNLGTYDTLTDFTINTDKFLLDGASHLSFNSDLGDLSGQGDIAAIVTFIEASGTIPTDSVVSFNDGANTYVYAKVSDPGDAYKDFFVVMQSVQGLSSADFEFVGGENTIIGTAAADTLVGTDIEDLILAGDGDDTLFGGLGDDVLLGEGGVDTAFFNNTISSYEIGLEGSVVTVEDIYTSIPNNEGRDSLIGMETLHFDAQGVPADARTITISDTAEILVNNYVAGDQKNPDVAVFEYGGAVVVYEGEDNTTPTNKALYFKLIDEDGSSAGEVNFTNAAGTNELTGAKVAALMTGSFIVTWTMGTAGSEDVYAQVFYEDGNVNPNFNGGSAWMVNSTTTGAQTDISVAAMMDGGFVTTWESDGNIMAKRFYGDGSDSGEFSVVVSGYVDSGAQVVGLNNNGYAIIWQTDDATNVAFKMRLYDSNNGVVTSDIMVDAQNVDDITSRDITVLENGNILVVGVADKTADGNEDALAMIYDTSGNTVAGPIILNSFDTDAETQVSAAGLSNGNFVAVWHAEGTDTDQGGIFGKIYDASGNPISSDNFLINAIVAGNQGNMRVEATEKGFVVIWEGDDATGRGIYMQEFNNDGTMSRGVAITGSADMDIISGGLGTQIIDGGAGDDTLYGGAGDDTFIASEGTDTIEGGDGTVDDGWDKVSFASAGTAVNVDLNSNSATTTVNTIASTTYLYGIEEIEGSANDDIITGNNNGNWLDGGAGNDTITGGTGSDEVTGGAGSDVINTGDGNDTIWASQGSDIINGGAGSDLISFDEGTGAEGITLDLSIAGNGILGDAGDQVVNTEFGTIDIAGVENVEGTIYDDTITGDANDNVLDGLEGIDVINGGDGNDTILGGVDGDTLTGGLGNDIFRYEDLGDIWDSSTQNFVGDVITDFTSGTDQLVFSKYGFDNMGTLTDGALAGVNFETFTALPTDAGITNAGPTFIFVDDQTVDSNYTALYYDADGNGTNYQSTKIAEFTNDEVITAADIIISST